MLQKLGGGTPKGRVMLLAFYNTKALGVRYLEGALERAGYQVQVVFYKEFNSHCPGQTSRRELELLCEEVRRAEPVFIGLSVMSSMYLDAGDEALACAVRHSAGLRRRVCQFVSRLLLGPGSSVCDPGRRGNSYG